MQVNVRSTLVDVAPEAIEQLRDRLRATRWPRAYPEVGWRLGTDLTYLQGLVHDWSEEFDWWSVQDRLNRFDQVEAVIDGQRIHAFHQRSPRPDATPLLLVHGWPGSVIEFIDCIGPLTDPDSFGVPGAPAFHVVSPSIPGYGFSGPTSELGWNGRRISRAFDDLMAALGYERYAGAGGDWGANILTDLARSDRQTSLTNLHLTMPTGLPPSPGEHEELSDFERESLAHWEHALATGRVNHVPTNSHRPHTYAVAMNDSPAGLLSWLVDMCRSFTVYEGDVEDALSREQLLANATIYWVTETLPSAMRLYWEHAQQKAADPHPPFVTVPTSVSIFPSDIRRWPRSWAERCLNITEWEVLPVGGHFGSWEQPQLFVDAVRRALGTSRA
ncbi:MAG: epoxide hydrolase [Candidatus Nanopelagicales bacterium]|nr:epoxide hydrolase [Candidatus Nanopelagicales bacterium]MCF8538147.1 epoxide hydrolase [Candidatus Nanopelagicales bacterium]MCF8542746.1 epoxide hydrolase [Candidatus Nanopelagicales bacterium]MCF8557677.1 epoxide hydrolase [Candidatus Nanopelagicales bacterium]